MSQQDVSHSLPPGIDLDRFASLIELAWTEDLAERGDITSKAIDLPEEPQQYALVARQKGVFCGKGVVAFLLGRLAPQARITSMMAGEDGLSVEAGTQIVVMECPPVPMLSAERTVLNFLQRLSGVATLTARYVAAIAGTGAKIYDTRKTVPGWRELDKYAVRCGGGCNHRVGLFDAVLLKDNHLAGVSADRLAEVVSQVIERTRRLNPPPWFVEVEVDSLAQLEALLPVGGIDVLLLDNFSLDDLRRAVQRRDRAAPGGSIELEASGGISLETVAAVARTGVERISVGALTHSAAALDLALDKLD
jgi:nicotinate-nucleotide pyrophosphorylase (carboxylating)